MKKKFGILFLIVILVFCASCGTAGKPLPDAAGTDTELPQIDSDPIYGIGFLSIEEFEEAIRFGTKNGELPESSLAKEYLQILKSWDGYYYPGTVPEGYKLNGIGSQPQYNLYQITFVKEGSNWADVSIAMFREEGTTLEQYVRGLYTGAMQNLQYKDGYYYDSIDNEPDNPLSQIFFEKDGVIFIAGFEKYWSWEQVMAFCEVQWVEVKKG